MATLQESYLNVLRREKVPCALYLVNGIKLQGVVESFDQFCIVIRNQQQLPQMLYKHAISTISPTRNINYAQESRRLDKILAKPSGVKVEPAPKELEPQPMEEVEA